MNLQSSTAEIYKFISADSELGQFLQDAEHACFHFRMGHIPFYIFWQLNNTFVTRILYGTPFASPAQEMDAFAFCDRVTVAVNRLYRERQRVPKPEK